MMTLANYGLGSGRHHKDPNSAKALSKSLQIRNRAELALKQCLKIHYRIPPIKRAEIINGIKDYYSRVPFDSVIWNKYQTKQCIEDSILLLDIKFNPLKVMKAFEIVEKMLMNLVYLPWHKEFRRIYVYSGQFRSSVSDPLIGVEEVFKAAGFKQESPLAAAHLLLADDKMPQVDDSESVTGVIFDCLIAQVIMLDFIESLGDSIRDKISTSDSEIDMNPNSWIQAYFHERSHSTSELARPKIQDLLNNATNHITRIHLHKIKSTSRSDIQSQNRLTSKSTNDLDSKTTPSDTKISPQDRTRNFLSQKALEDEKFRLVDDLLRLPPETERKQTGSKSHMGNLNGSFPKLDDRFYLESNSSSNLYKATVQNNGYTNRNAQENSSAIVSRPSDTIDYPGSSGTHLTSNNDSLGHQIIVDSPHNDRELLIPRQDRHLASNNGQPQVYATRRQKNHYDSDLNFVDTHNNHQHEINDLSSRHHQINKPYYSSSSSHPTKNQSMKYGNSPNAKYESRNLDKGANHKVFWSCRSCTFNNELTSQICEMCRNRR